MLRIVTLLLLATISVAASVKIIYGEDNRKDIYELIDVDLIALSSSTVGLVESSSLTKNSDGIFLTTKNYGNSMDLCKDEKFYNQPVGAFCSGFLIDKDIIVTAGHCINSQSCNEISFVFDFKMLNSKEPVVQFTEDQVYSCKSVLKWARIDDGADYAVIQLDRAVVDRHPLKIRESGAIAVGEKLIMLGHPSGLPLKYADDAVVRKVIGTTHLVANTDSYGGNSGSVIINAETFEVEGILVRGDTDFVYDSKNKCYRSNVCKNDECRGEDITLISNIL